MITDSEPKRRYGLSAPQAIGVIVACAVFMLALLAMLPDT